MEGAYPKSPPCLKARHGEKPRKAAGLRPAQRPLQQQQCRRPDNLRAPRTAHPHEPCPMTGPSHELPDDPRLAALDADDLQRYREHGCPSDLDAWMHWLSVRKRDAAAIREMPARLGLTENWGRLFSTLMQRFELLETLPGLRPDIYGDPVSVLTSFLVSVEELVEPGVEREAELYRLLTHMECWSYRITSTGECFDLRIEPFRAFLARYPAHELTVEFTPGEPLVPPTEAFRWLRRELYRGGKG